ncbi:lysophospholipid acyltransferase family protein [Limisalsivibrio acetivorans]|uniref:lysophospholipid acyltransferase family protein n=1 Tax=Limisalsivibrio acetivorans TaxID=1304888 RepID=UPI0003B793DD|nr:lysophospholipid acyltransferase family protein [Limisalsivibrio acetivorans]
MKALAVKALYSVLGRLSLNSLRRTGFFLGTLLYYLSPSRRKAAIKNARVIGAENPVKTARKACRHNMASFMESFYNGRIDQDFVKNRLKVTFIGEKPDFERTYFIVTAHFGSWELSSGLYRNYIQKDLGLLARRFKDPEIDNLVQKLRGDSEMITYLHHRNCTEDMLRLLGDGVNIAALLDHSATMKDCIMVPLFGIKTTFIKGIPTLSAKMDIPLLPAFFKRTNEGVELIMYPPIEPDKSLKPRERIYDLALRVNKVYEDLFSRYPEQWYLIHKRFKKTEDENGEITDSFYR